MHLIACLALAGCQEPQTPVYPPPQPVEVTVKLVPVSDCEQAIADRDAAIQAQVNVCAKLGGPVTDPTGACQRLIDAARAAQERSASVCAGGWGR
jgi:hypothetical protein